MSIDERIIKVAALQAVGRTQHQIAQELGVSRSTVQNDLAAVNDTKLAAIQARIALVLPAEQRVDEYIELLEVAKTTKQPSAGSQILQRLDDLDGVLTSKDRIKAAGGPDTAPGPMFIFQGDVNIDYGSCAAGPPLPSDLGGNDLIDVQPIVPPATGRPPSEGTDG